MRNSCLIKALAVAVIILFIGLAIQPSVAITRDRINHPPGPPLLEGPRSVRPGTYEWSFKSIDSNGDDLFYLIDWGDGDIDKWIGPYPSGEKIKVSHTYYEVGTACIMARAKDIHGAIGDVGTFDIEISIEPKDYLFQTIIDFANNPEVENLLEQYKYDFFEVDIDRSVYRKLFFRNPRLLFDTLFTKPTMTIEYLNKCFNNGIGFTNILGEDKTLEIIENVKVTDIGLFDTLNNIISEDEKLSNRLEKLKLMNKELNPVTPIEDIICPIAYMLFLLICILTIFFFPIDIIAEAIDMISNPILEGILILVYLPIYIPISILYLTIVIPMFSISNYLMVEYDCLPYTD